MTDFKLIDYSEAEKELGFVDKELSYTDKNCVPLTNNEVLTVLQNRERPIDDTILKFKDYLIKTNKDSKDQELQIRDIKNVIAFNCGIKLN